MVKIERDLDKIYRILWLDDERSIIESAYRTLRTLPIEFLGVTRLSEAKKIVETQKLALVISDQKLTEGSGIDFLEWIKSVDQTVTRVLLTGYLESPLLENAVNRAAVFRFISKPWSVEDLRRDVLQALQHHDRILEHEELRKEYRTQNKLLEVFTSGLERQVAERTLVEEKSKTQIEENVIRTRDLVRFVKELSFSHSLEDVMALLHRELKSFPEVKSPIFCYQTPDQKPMVAFLQAKQAIEKEAKSIWPTSENELTHRQYLADVFGRPFAKVLAFPMVSNSRTELTIHPIFYIEHSLSDENLFRLQNFIEDRIQSLAIALERILLEFQLRYISYQWARTFDSIQDPIAIVDVDYRLVRANRSFAPAPGKKCYEEFTGKSEVCEGCPVVQALQTGLPSTGQIRRGHQIFEVHSYPIRVKTDTRVTNFINHYLDITSARELHGRVIQSEKMAAVGLLAGNIAHELNNPLTGIRSLAQILIKEITTAEAPSQLIEDLSEVEKAAGRSQKIIENLLSFSKPEFEHQKEVVDLNDLVTKTLPILKTAMREHNCDVVLCDDILLIDVEPHLFQQVIFNLVNNACQAMSETGNLQIRTEAYGKDVHLVIKDSGMGISEELRSRIFEPFFTTKSEGKGTGLGLSMSLSIVNGFGGLIELESELEKGSTFYVSLPRVLTTK